MCVYVWCDLCVVCDVCVVHDVCAVSMWYVCGWCMKCIHYVWCISSVHVCVWGGYVCDVWICGMCVMYVWDACTMCGLVCMYLCYACGMCMLVMYA